MAYISIINLFGDTNVLNFKKFDFSRNVMCTQDGIRENQKMVLRTGSLENSYQLAKKWRSPCQVGLPRTDTVFGCWKREQCTSDPRIVGN